MGERKRRAMFEGVRSIAGYGEIDHALTNKVRDLFIAEAEKQENGLLPASEARRALVFHLVQILRSAPAEYKQTLIDETCEVIRECADVPVPAANRMIIGEEGEA